MNHREVCERIAERLLARLGWERHPERDHHFRHPDAAVAVLVYEAEITVLFGRLEGQRHDKAVSASTRYYPALAIDAAVETAAALVASRMRVIDAAHLNRQRQFSELRFGPGMRTAMVLEHIRKELAEIEAAPTDLGEWADVIILALDGAWRAGHRPQEIIDAIIDKQGRNEARTWPDWRTAGPGAIEHDRTGE